MSKLAKNNLFKCIYCTFWSKSAVIRRDTDSDSSKKSKHRMITRVCPIAKKNITADSNSCEYFSPSSNFYCDKNNCFMPFIACLNRRRNQKSFDGFSKCSKCRQFDRDIKLIIRTYWLNCKKILIPKGFAKEKEVEEVEEEKHIKRRSKKPTPPESKKQLKRRSKKIEEPKIKPKRKKLKRRNKK